MRYTIFILSLIITLFLFGCAQNDIDHRPDCVMGVKIHYSYNQTITDDMGAKEIAEEYATSGLGEHRNRFSEMTISNIEFDRDYKEKKYWVATFSYVDKEAKESGNAQFHVSEDGEIVNLLGCI